MPYRVVASFFDEFGTFRDGVELSRWQLDQLIEPAAFVSIRVARADRIPFALRGAP